MSHWQIDKKAPIDWAKVAAAGKAFVFLKASEDIDYEDPTYQNSRAGAKANGLLVGAYHFARPDVTPGDAVAEADHFIDTAGPVPGELLPVLDLEDNGPIDNPLTAAQLQAWVQEFLQRVYDRTGVRATIYVSPSFWKDAKKMANSQWFAANGYTILWIAHWKPADGVPTVPAANWGGNGWTFWQYASDGVVPGIEGRVDLNVFNPLRGDDFTSVLIP